MPKPAFRITSNAPQIQKQSENFTQKAFMGSTAARIADRAE